MRKALVYMLISMSLVFVGYGIIQDITTEIEEVNHIEESCTKVYVVE